MFLKPYLLLLFIGLARTGISQNCDHTLKGQVNDADNQEHLAFAVIRLVPAGIAVQSDDHGNFELDKLCAGTYTLSVQHVGCRDTSIVVNVPSMKKIVLTLPHSLNALSDVEVVTEHVDERPAQSVYILTKKDLAAVRGDNLARQLELVPGIRSLATGPNTAKPMLNGMQGYRVLLLHNGVRLEGQQWGTEHAPEIDPYAAGRITVVSGASAVRYGSDALAGVVLVEPEHMPDTAAIVADVTGTYETNGRLHSQAAVVQGYFDRLKYFSWRVQGSLRNGGNIKTGEGVYLDNTGLREKNFSYTLDYHRARFGISVYYSQFNARTGIYSGAHAQNLTDLFASLGGQQRDDTARKFSRAIDSPYQYVAHELIKVRSDIHTGPRSRFNFVYANQYNRRSEFDRHGEESGISGETHAAADYRIATHTGELSWEHDHIRSWRGRTGVQAMTQKNAGEGHVFVPNFRNENVGIFVVERFVRPHYELEAGVRFDHRVQQAFFYEGDQLTKPLREFGNISYNAGGLLRYDRFRATANIGRAWRAPSMNELYAKGLHHGAAVIERGNPGLANENATSYNLSVESDFAKLVFRLSGYHYRFDNFIYVAPAGYGELTIRGAFPVFNYTAAAAGISGADATARYEIAPFLSAGIRGMWVRGTVGRSGDHLNFMPSDRYGVSLAFHSKKGKQNEFFLEPSIVYTAKQNRFTRGFDFADPPAGYLLLNTEAGIRFSVSGQGFELSLSGRNLLDAVYRDYLDTFRYFADAPGRSIVFRVRMPITVFDKQ